MHGDAFGDGGGDAAEVLWMEFESELRFHFSTKVGD